MSATHYLNAVLWLANTVVWAGYTHSVAMSVLSFLAMLLSLYMARSAQ